MSEEPKVIMRIWKARRNGSRDQLMVTIPAKSSFKENDYVEIRLVETPFRKDM